MAQVLRECGFEVEVERKFKTARDTTEVDVYAEETHRRRKSVILCECKHWKSKVPQSVVHSFRSTMADSGANVGYIIGSNGFQPGAVSATSLTNVRLRTWEQFQDEFAVQWLETHVVPNFWHSVDKFLTWTERLPPALGRPLTEPEAEIFWEVWRSYQPLVALLMPFMPWARRCTTWNFPPSARRTKMESAPAAPGPLERARLP